MSTNAENGFRLLPEKDYFRLFGADVMAFSDFYPAGHQSGVTLVLHDERLAAGGDLRLEPTPGQWQPVPRQVKRVVDPEQQQIVTRLRYPDPEGHLQGFNPMLYPDISMGYSVTVRAAGPSVEIVVDLEKTLPKKWDEKLWFNLELFPGAMEGKSWLMDGAGGIFPTQPNGPVMTRPSQFPATATLPAPPAGADRMRLAGGGAGYSPIVADDLIAQPYARGRVFTACPEEPLSCFTVESRTEPMQLFDGRLNHNNGWFVLSAPVRAGAKEHAVHWVLTPRVDPEWMREPVVQVSQVGYHPAMPKFAVVELDGREKIMYPSVLERVTPEGIKPVVELRPRAWGDFLRHRYLTVDFSKIREPGIYRVRYGVVFSSLFRIAPDVFDRGVWQPVLEYFLPVQMCHMRVNEKYRVWHDACHLDDARMAPVNYNHIDGYVQGPSTLTRYESGQHVPGLNVGGWHDAGDFDLRIESQAGECGILAAAYEEFGVEWDATTVDQERRVVEIHQPDGKNDLLQQIEHGLLSIVGGYRALGRLYRGIICADLRQYVLLGDSAAMTDGAVSADDRWVFTEDNPRRELTAAGDLAAAARAIMGYNPELGEEALEIAETLFRETRDGDALLDKYACAAELFLATGKAEYRSYLQDHLDRVEDQPQRLGWVACRAEQRMKDPAFTEALGKALASHSRKLRKLGRKTPYGIPYEPHIWGAGWDIQRQGFAHYFLHRSYPKAFPREGVFNALNFVLGCHPGRNTASFASGVGTRSATVAYGLNRADRSFIPGGVISGTALIRPDLPELKEFPYLWQQTEYVLGGGSSHFLFLVLAARRLAEEAAAEMQGA